jgi:hypothetical protein
MKITEPHVDLWADEMLFSGLYATRYAATSIMTGLYSSSPSLVKPQMVEF